MADASLIISHAGAGSVLEGMRLRARMVVVVNDALMDNHQQELAQELHSQGKSVGSRVCGLLQLISLLRPDTLFPHHRPFAGHHASEANRCTTNTATAQRTIQTFPGAQYGGVPKVSCGTSRFEVRFRLPCGACRFCERVGAEQQPWLCIVIVCMYGMNMDKAVNPSSSVTHPSNKRIPVYQGATDQYS
jgi:hypothetical protein